MTRNGPSASSPVQLSRADYILLALPLLFVGISATTFWLIGTQTYALGLAAVVCGLVLVDGLVWNPPV